MTSVLSGRDTLVILPTGGGKSLCYQVPALVLPKLTVVVSPLISLMKDQVDALVARGLPAAFINSTLTGAEVGDRIARAQSGDLKLLYVAPERFDSGTTAERLRAAGVSLLAVDEAHCISEWGHDFRPSYLRIRQVRDRLGAPPTVALTATATPEVRRDIVRQLALERPETIITGFDRTNLTYNVLHTRTEQDKDDALVRVLREREGLAIVYASTRKSVERVSQVLASARIEAVAYHAGLDDAHRHDVQDRFMCGEVRAIVATNAFGMGIDKATVRLVIHHAMPGTLEAYYQEAGRAGRDGKPSDCFLLHAFPDRFTHEFFIKGAYPERITVEAVYGAMRRHAETGGVVRLGAAQLAAAMGGRAKERDIESALRILVQAGVVATESSSSTRVFVRLLATPERIKRELGSADEVVERDLLRALWRAVGTRLQDGCTIDPDGLPPGFGGCAGVTSALDSLQARQFVMWERTGGGMRLTRPGAPLEDFRLDWDALDRRRRADLAKLDAMQRYAYTPGCRRGFVLRYFGDPAARHHCEGCDNCLGTHVPVAKGTPAPTRRAPRDRTARTGGAADSPSNRELSPAETALLESLKSLRRTIARDEQVPAYVVFADRTLVEMAACRPESLTEMQHVRGVGPAKLKRYGQRFLEIIQQADET